MKNTTPRPLPLPSEAACTSVAEVAGLLRVSEQTVGNWWTAGSCRLCGSARGGFGFGRPISMTSWAAERSSGLQIRRNRPALKVDPEVIDALRAFGEAAIRLADALQPPHSS